MNTVEIIQTKVIHLPPRAQEEILDAIERIETRYLNGDAEKESGVGRMHALTAIATLAEDVGITDLSVRHNFYAHGKLEE